MCVVVGLFPGGAGESPWVSFLPVSLSSECWLGWFEASVVRLLDLDRRAVIGLAVETSVVPPPHVLERRELDLLDRPPRALSTDQLGLVEPVDCLGEGVVVAVTDAPCRRGRAELVDAIRVDDPEVVRPMIGVVDEVIERPARASRGHVQRL